jgi:hypothetical protein
MLGTLVGCAELLELLDPMLGTDAGCAELYFPMLGTETGGGGPVLCACASETMTVTSAPNAVATRVFFIMSSHSLPLHRNATNPTRDHAS